MCRRISHITSCFSNSLLNKLTWGWSAMFCISPSLTSDSMHGCSIIQVASWFTVVDARSLLPTKETSIWCFCSSHINLENNHPNHLSTMTWPDTNTILTSFICSKSVKSKKKNKLANNTIIDLRHDCPIMGRTFYEDC